MASKPKIKPVAPEAAKPPRKSGGPVFPQIFGKTFGPQTSGITLRQYYAGQAMMGLLSRPDIDEATTAKSAVDLAETPALPWKSDSADPISPKDGQQLGKQMKSFRSVCYLYRCQRCRRESKGGSSAKRCKLPNLFFSIMRNRSLKRGVCNGPLVRVKTLREPLPTKLKIAEKSA